MKSEVVVKGERPESEEEADRSDGLSGGTLEASSLAELGEESLAQAEDDGGTKKKRKKRKAFYSCRFCDKVFDQGQALGGHMNCHLGARTREKLLHYEKLLKQTNSRTFWTVNPMETSSYPISNFNQPGDGYSMVTPMVPMQPTRFIQQPQGQMGPSQVWPVDPQQLHWLQVPTDGYMPHSMDPSMSSQLTSQYRVPAPSSMPYYVSYGYSAPCDYSNLSGLGTYQEPPTNMHCLHTQGFSAPCDYGDPSCSETYQEPQTDMHCLHTQGFSAPCDYGDPSCSETYQEPQTDMQSLHTQGFSAPCDYCDPSCSETYQEPQTDMQSLDTEEEENFSPTSIMNEPRLSTPPHVEMASSSSVQYHAQSSIDSISEMGIQEMAGPRGTRLGPNPSDASDAGANHFDEWSGNPSDHT